MEVDIQTSPKTNGQELSPKLMDVPETNGTAKEIVNQSPETKKRVTRSRSRTPKKQPKRSSNKRDPTPDMNKIVEDNKETETNGDQSKTVEEEAKPKENEPEEKKTEESVTKEVQPNESLNGNNEEELKEKDVEKTKEVKKGEGEQVDMDPLILNADEPDPELEFDENSDMESGSSSPVLSRCKTRRSLTRNIPTPKTPKSMETEPESETATVDSPKKSTPLDNTYDSIDVKDLSTRAEDGGDTTRLNFDESMGESYLENYKNRSLRGLSARRSIRPGSDYLKRAIRNNHERPELNMPTTGIKRKNRSLTPEDRKKMRTSESASSLLSMFSSPFSSIRNKFHSEVTSSTPKLTAYKDENGLSYTDDQIEVESGLADKKSWCSLM